ncbi:hypothetical protein RAC83_002482, partial [Xylella fastidiosa]|nr:hypothetical protein [Xylella fastidiosa]
NEKKPIMHTTNLRKVGGSIMLAVSPRPFLFVVLRRSLLLSLGYGVRADDGFGVRLRFKFTTNERDPGPV